MVIRVMFGSGLFLSYNIRRFLNQFTASRSGYSTMEDVMPDWVFNLFFWFFTPEYQQIARMIVLAAFVFLVLRSLVIGGKSWKDIFIYTILTIIVCAAAPIIYVVVVLVVVLAIYIITMVVSVIALIFALILAMFGITF